MRRGFRPWIRKDIVRCRWARRNSGADVVECDVAGKVVPEVRSTHVQSRATGRCDGLQLHAIPDLRFELHDG